LVLAFFFVETAASNEPDKVSTSSATMTAADVTGGAIAEIVDGFGCLDLTFFFVEAAASNET
jgi:hypothetical protein